MGRKSVTASIIFFLRIGFYNPLAVLVITKVEQKYPFFFFKWHLLKKKKGKNVERDCITPEKEFFIYVYKNK